MPFASDSVGTGHVPSWPGRTDWSRLVKPSLLGVAPYDPGESLSELKARHGLDEILKLNWNEGLFGPIPGALAAAEAELRNAWMYPEQAYADLRDDLAAWLGLLPQQIVPAHGIQALVGVLAAAFITSGTRVVVPTPTYGLYRQVFTAAGADVRLVPLGGYRLDLEALGGATRAIDARLVVVCDPNNPTGEVVSAAEWERFLDDLPGGCVVVCDEAYVEYVDPAARLARERGVEAGRPLILLRTFSKIFGLAGLRMGYAIAAEPLASFLDVVQEPFNVNRVGLAAARASLRPEVVEERRLEAAAAKELLGARLAEAGCRTIPSQANFLLAEIGVDDVALVESLARRGVLVRAGSEFGLPGTVRITVAPPPVMERAAAEIAAARAALLAQAE
jgi:histidinol-phosphate aminotransferase